MSDSDRRGSGDGHSHSSFDHLGATMTSSDEEDVPMLLANQNHLEIENVGNSINNVETKNTEDSNDNVNVETEIPEITIDMQDDPNGEIQYRGANADMQIESLDPNLEITTLGVVRIHAEDGFDGDISAVDDLGASASSISSSSSDQGISDKRGIPKSSSSSSSRRDTRSKQRSNKLTRKNGEVATKEGELDKKIEALKARHESFIRRHHLVRESMRKSGRESMGSVESELSILVGDEDEDYETWNENEVRSLHSLDELQAIRAATFRAIPGETRKQETARREQFLAEKEKHVMENARTLVWNAQMLAMNSQNMGEDGTEARQCRRQSRVKRSAALYEYPERSSAALYNIRTSANIRPSAAMAKHNTSESEMSGSDDSDEPGTLSVKKSESTKRKHHGSNGGKHGKKDASGGEEDHGSSSPSSSDDAYLEDITGKDLEKKQKKELKALEKDLTEKAKIKWRWTLLIIVGVTIIVVVALITMLHFCAFEPMRTQAVEQAQKKTNDVRGANAAHAMEQYEKDLKQWDKDEAALQAKERLKLAAVQAANAKTAEAKAKASEAARQAAEGAKKAGNGIGDSTEDDWQDHSDNPFYPYPNQNVPYDPVEHGGSEWDGFFPAVSVPGRPGVPPGMGGILAQDGMIFQCFNNTKNAFLGAIGQSAGVQPDDCEIWYSDYDESNDPNADSGWGFDPTLGISSLLTYFNKIVAWAIFLGISIGGIVLLTQFKPLTDVIASFLECILQWCISGKSADKVAKCFGLFTIWLPIVVAFQVVEACGCASIILEACCPFGVTKVNWWGWVHYPPFRNMLGKLPYCQHAGERCDNYPPGKCPKWIQKKEKEANASWFDWGGEDVGSGGEDDGSGGSGDDDSGWGLGIFLQDVVRKDPDKLLLNSKAGKRLMKQVRLASSSSFSLSTDEASYKAQESPIQSESIPRSTAISFVESIAFPVESKPTSRDVKPTFLQPNRMESDVFQDRHFIFTKSEVKGAIGDLVRAVDRVETDIKPAAIIEKDVLVDFDLNDVNDIESALQDDNGYSHRESAWEEHEEWIGEEGEEVENHALYEPENHREGNAISWEENALSNTIQDHQKSWSETEIRIAGRGIGRYSIHHSPTDSASHRFWNDRKHLRSPLTILRTGWEQFVTSIAWNLLRFIRGFSDVIDELWRLEEDWFTHVSQMMSSFLDTLFQDGLQFLEWGLLSFLLRKLIRNYFFMYYIKDFSMYVMSPTLLHSENVKSSAEILVENRGSIASNLPENSESSRRRRRRSTTGFDDWVAGILDWNHHVDDSSAVGRGEHERNNPDVGRRGNEGIDYHDPDDSSHGGWFSNGIPENEIVDWYMNWHLNNAIENLQGVLEEWWLTWSEQGDDDWQHGNYTSVRFGGKIKENDLINRTVLPSNYTELLINC